MADRGRDLKFSILSDVEKFDTDKPAKGLEDLADSAEAAGKAVDKLSDVASRTDLDRLHQDAQTSTRSVDDLADAAKDTARKVDDAFDRIAKSSRQNLTQKMDDDLDNAKRGLDDFKDEAAGSGREAAASFSGGFDDITGFIQETAANAFGGFGPLGAAAGIAAAAGIGIITKVFSDSKEQAEEAKQAVGEWVQAFTDGAGRIQEAAIATKLQSMFGDADQRKAIITDAREAGVSAELFARALAGDGKAAKEVESRVRAASKAIDENQHRTAESEAATLRQRNALKRVATQLGITTGQINEGRDAWEVLDAATRAGITANVDTNVPTRAQLAAEHAQMQRELGRTVKVPIEIKATRAAQLAWLEADRYFRLHPITLRTKPGARPVRDVP